MLNGFDAEINEIDRRIYYEITESQLVEGEFDGEDTSDEEWTTLNQVDPLGFALNYQETRNTELRATDLSAADYS